MSLKFIAYIFVDEFVFLRRGSCDTSSINGNHQNSIRECYDECMKKTDVKYFAYIGKEDNNDDNCICYKIDGGCPVKTSSSDYNVYEINPGI